MASDRTIIAHASDLDTSGAGFTVTRGDGSETIVTSGSGAYRTHRIVRQTYPQLPSSILPDISAAQLPAGVQPQYTITSGNGYRVVQVTWSY